eukprot:TRINITY_DN968_c0_g1_i1.p1 TRINITY_DN968_c0_g1~~TRINITY_DN968_c0_g1_i1.p1  ORF type:complete len:211 (-),score=26.90 TRINITY_DN968_c0_g1_i1:217-849(-)
MRKPYSCLKITLLVLNTVFLALGIILFASGAYAYSNLQDLAALLSIGLPIGLIVIGIFIFILSFFGCCSVAVENRIMILIYIFILLILLVCQIAIGGAAYTQANNFQKTLGQNWNLLTSEQKDSIELRYACCGFDQPEYSRCKQNYTTPTGQPITCQNRIVTDFKNKLLLVGAMGVIFGCLEIIGLCFALVLYCCIGSKHRREKKERLLG